jgi:hypothetical protein
MVSFGLLLALWIVATGVANVVERIGSVQGPLLSRLARQPLAIGGCSSRTWASPCSSSASPW